MPVADPEVLARGSELRGQLGVGSGEGALPEKMNFKSKNAHFCSLKC